MNFYLLFSYEYFSAIDFVTLCKTFKSFWLIFFNKSSISKICGETLPAARSSRFAKYSTLTPKAFAIKIAFETLGSEEAYFR